MSGECWTCARCGGAIPGGVPAFLVVPGAFAARSLGRRLFTADGGEVRGLCWGCRELRLPVPEPEPPKVCVNCSEEIPAGAEVVLCKACEDSKLALRCDKCGTLVSDPAVTLCGGCDNGDGQPLTSGVEVAL